jgi:hypothetical protein
MEDQNIFQVQKEKPNSLGQVSFIKLKPILKYFSSNCVEVRLNDLADL